MNYADLTEKELLRLANTLGLHNEEINEEWFNRYGVNFPYRLDHWGRILNCLSLKIVKEDECDKLVLRQVKEVRSNRVSKFYE